MSRPSFTLSTEVLVQTKVQRTSWSRDALLKRKAKMMTNNKAGQLLRRTALSAAMLLIAAPAALADPPGYLFRDFDDAAPATVSAPIAPAQRNAANQEAARVASAPAFANVVESSRSACAREGLSPGTSDFAACVVKAERSPTNARYGASIAAH